MERRCGIIACIAAAILSVAAIWLGALNQDEGWYLYAAELVRDGLMPYRDFFYTQGPLMPIVYSAFSWAWTSAGLVGARAVTLAIGLAGIGLSVALVRELVPAEKRTAASVTVILLLACNLYHLYYLTIPKTYALASFFVAGGYYLLVRAMKTPESARPFTAPGFYFAAGLSLAFAAGTRISLGALLAVCGFGLLFMFFTRRFAFLWFGLGGLSGLSIVYGPFLFDSGAFEGLCAAQKYHAARGGFSAVFVTGSLSRLVRWYLPVWILLGLAVAMRRIQGSSGKEECAARGACGLLFAGFLAVFLVQMLAPFPYEDYQVPVMGLAAVLASVLVSVRVMETRLAVVLAMGLAFATSFGSPLLEKWTTDGQDRFWSIIKDKPELMKLQEAAREIDAMDPGGKTILTQDLYLAIETGRRVPAGLEMGPFSMLDDASWRAILEDPESPRIAALSGYSFAIDPPVCRERNPEKQREYRDIVARRYALKREIKAFGQNSTLLQIYERREEL
ncbi:MAG: hypothetical protein K6F50_02550 [Kiritimatiellae bacterium]|nr:hypothetical protein [Kiritimatiellia bacterium]